METLATKEPIPVEVQDLHKKYGRQVVLRGVDFDVKPGEIFVLMGPSGSGKSVLLRQVVGLEAPDRGEVKIAGLNAAQRETHERYSTALVFQAGALFNSMTVFDNLALYPREHRLYPEAKIREKVEAVLEILSLKGAAKKIPAELSGGMRKRVAVARAIVMEPQLILYDEPTSELDPVTAATVAELIATVRKETQATSIVVTHDRNLAMGIGDRVGFLFKGKLAFVGTPRELEETENEAVREFLSPIINPDNPRFRLEDV